MTTTEHLDAIVARCTELLAIAEKRTQGEWKYETEIFDGWGGDERGHYVTYGKGLNVCLEAGEADATFIAACAGTAEAGWRATIAAIRVIRAMSFVSDRSGFTAEIIAAWPPETLKP